MSFLIGTAIIFLVTFATYKLIKFTIRVNIGFWKELIIGVSMILYFINTLLVGGSVFGLLAALIYQYKGKLSTAFIVGGIIGFLVFSLVYHYGHSTKHPKLEYAFHLIFGIVDGTFIASLVNSMYLQKHYDVVPRASIISLYVYFIIVMIEFSFLEKKMSNYYAE